MWDNLLWDNLLWDNLPRDNLQIDDKLWNQLPCAATELHEIEVRSGRKVVSEG